MAEVQTFLEAILKVSLRSACPTDKAFSLVKSKISNWGLQPSSARLSYVY